MAYRITIQRNKLRKVLYTEDITLCIKTLANRMIRYCDVPSTYGADRELDGELVAFFKGDTFIKYSYQKVS